MYAMGAKFVEVRVHAETREVRVPRIVGAFAAGHIVNPRTARSQLLGGMIWGISAALFEATEIDPRNARYVNDNLADYSVPVCADIRDIEALLVPERDDYVSPLGIKGLGELGMVNAVYHATGPTAGPAREADGLTSAVADSDRNQTCTLRPAAIAP
jgi:xanthine dehydrogenase YagR molybdenum-binding subunit